MKIFLLCALVAGCCEAWNYDPAPGTLTGPSSWPGQCVLPLCSMSQSPIDIQSPYPPFSYTGYSSANIELHNNGNTVFAKLQSTATLSGGPLTGNYKLEEIHLHWGSTDSQGSEHRLDGVQYPMEVQFVHYDTTYVSLAEAEDKPDGLAILAYFVEIGSFNPSLNDIINTIPAVGVVNTISSLDLTQLMVTQSSYAHYKGSQTTPECYQSVLWSVFRTPIEIKNTQLNVLRNLVGVSADNFRPLQSLNGRPVYFSP